MEMLVCCDGSKVEAIMFRRVETVKVLNLAGGQGGSADTEPMYSDPYRTFRAMIVFTTYGLTSMVNGVARTKLNLLTVFCLSVACPHEGGLGTDAVARAKFRDDMTILRLSRGSRQYILFM
jgi:hypothetical protein